MIEKIRKVVESLGYPFFFGTRDEVYAYINRVRTCVAVYRQGNATGASQSLVFKFKGNGPQKIYYDVFTELKNVLTIGVQRTFFYDDVLEVRCQVMSKTMSVGSYVRKSPDYLKFTAQGSATISMTHENYTIDEHPVIEISPDAKNWETWNFTLIDDYWVADEIELEDGETVYMRGNNPNGIGGYYIEEEQDYDSYYFVIDGYVAASGDLNCLIDKLGGKETTIAEMCYSYIFFGCTGLTSAPELPATTLAEMCYTSMFQYCTGLTSIEVHATEWNTSWAGNWVESVSATGIFRKPSGTTIPTGTNGIPSGWTVINV